MQAFTTSPAASRHVFRMTVIYRCERSASGEGFRTRSAARLSSPRKRANCRYWRNSFSVGLRHRISVARLSREEVHEHEPHVSCLAGVHVLSTGITNYSAVCHAIVDDLRGSGADLRVGTELLHSTVTSDGHVLETTSGEFSARFLITCAGLHSDRVSIRCGSSPEVRIVPFRGEYYELKPERRHLVKNLVYPVANPNFPFLGVHFTRMIDGAVHAGPNAVLALKREGYSKLSFSPKDAMDTLTYPGFWRLAAKYYRDGFSEMARSASKTLFTRSLQRLIPEIEADDLIPSHAGVRAQALKPDGAMVDDFLIEEGKSSLHVLNAPPLRRQLLRWRSRSILLLEFRNRYVQRLLPQPKREGASAIGVEGCGSPFLITKS